MCADSVDKDVERAASRSFADFVPLLLPLQFILLLTGLIGMSFGIGATAVLFVLSLVVGVGTTAAGIVLSAVQRDFRGLGLSAASMFVLLWSALLGLLFGGHPGS